MLKNALGGIFYDDFIERPKGICTKETLHIHRFPIILGNPNIGNNRCTISNNNICIRLAIITKYWLIPTLPLMLIWILHMPYSAKESLNTLFTTTLVRTLASWSSDFINETTKILTSSFSLMKCLSISACFV